METLASDIVAPANAELAPAQTSEVDSEGASAPGEGSAPSVPEADTPEPRDKVQERIDKLTREKYDALRERDQRDYELEALRQRVAQQTDAAKRETSQVAPEAFPTLEQHGYDEAKYQAAVAQHFTKLATEQARTAAQRELEAARQQETAQRTNQEWSKREADFIKSKPDYVEKVQQARTLPISHEMQQILKGYELGPQIAYHLVENPEAALAIARLPPATQALEVGRIAERIAAAKAAPKPPVSQAPPPPPKVEATPVTEKDWGQLTDKEFAERRRRQIAQRRNG